MLALLLLVACSEYDVFDTREETFVETFDIGGARSDVLFYADTSYSMQRELMTLGDAIGQFITRLDDNSQDWRIIAVTGPTGCGIDTVFTPETPDLHTRFKTAVMTPPGEEEADEWGLFNVYKAVLESGPGGCNEGFVRDNASLHVVFLSDEEDTSPGWQLGGDYWRDYVDPVLYLKDDPALVRFSAVVGPLPNGCEGAEPGKGYVEAAQATGGEVLPICGEWSSSLDVLADASIQVSFFPLPHTPLPDTIAIHVNDVPREGGWTYSTEEGGVRFTEAPAGAWDVVRIGYRAFIEVPAGE